MNAEDLRPFFEPSSVVLVGVSRDMNKFNGVILKNLLEVGYPGKIFLVNPYAGEILGLKCYPRIMDLPETPELAIILHADVEPILENCGKKGITHVSIQVDISLKDDSDRERAEQAITEIAGRYGITFIGPSIIGLFNYPARFTSSLIPVREHVARLGLDPDRAAVGYMAQSGGLAGACGWWAPSQEISFAKVVHFNAHFAGAVEDGAFLEYIAADEQVKVICIFVRSITDSLVEGVRTVTDKKPVLFKKCGRPLNIEKLEEVGAFDVENYNDLFEVAKAFVFSPLPRGNRIGVIGPSSGAIDLVLSEFKRYNLELAKPTPDVEQEISVLLQGMAAKRCNPVDFWPPKQFYGYEIGRIHHDAADALLSDPNVDAIFLVLEFFNEIEFDLATFKDVLGRYPDKPIMGVLIQAEEEGATRVKKIATELKIPIYSAPETLVKAYSLLYRFSKHVGGLDDS
jgi:acyl-CoA synthetase (NDP forming)